MWRHCLRTKKVVLQACRRQEKCFKCVIIHKSSVVVDVIRRHTCMLSVNCGRSQSIRFMLSAFTKTIFFILFVIEVQIKHCEK